MLILFLDAYDVFKKQSDFLSTIYNLFNISPQTYKWLFGGRFRRG